MPAAQGRRSGITSVSYTHLDVYKRQDMVTLPGTAVETVIYDEYHPNQEEIMEIVLDWFYRPRE